MPNKVNADRLGVTMHKDLIMLTPVFYFIFKGNELFKLYFASYVSFYYIYLTSSKFRLK